MVCLVICVYWGRDRDWSDQRSDERQRGSWDPTEVYIHDTMKIGSEERIGRIAGRLDRPRSGEPDELEHSRDRIMMMLLPRHRRWYVVDRDRS